MGDCCRRCGDTPRQWIHYRLEVIRRIEAVYGAYLHTLVAAHLVMLVPGELEIQEEVMCACWCYAF